MLFVSFAAAAAVGLAIASADDGSDVPETFVTKLEPGVNLVGWVNAEKPIEGLFEELPRIELAFAWDSHAQRYIWAAPAVPRAMWTLQTLRPGMGIAIRLGGSDAIQWTRPRKPAQGAVRLFPGHNLVAWMGRDSASLAQVVKGVGGSFVGVDVRTGRSDQVAHQDIGSSAGSDQEPRILFGSAIWVETTANVYWLQPTGYLPEIRFSPDASTSLKARVLSDFRDVVDLYWHEFGFEADYSAFRLLVPDSHGAYLEMTLPAGPDLEHRIERTLTLPRAASNWNNLPGYGGAGEAMIQQSFWEEPQGKYTRGRTLLMHEYTHVVQANLRGLFQSPLHRSPSTLRTLVPEVPGFLTEGMALFAEDLILIADGLTTPEQAEMDAWRSTRGRPALPEARNSIDAYSLGHGSMYLLTANSDPKVLYDFFRNSGTYATGPNLHWQTHTPWQSAFLKTFDTSIAAFGEQFASTRPGDLGPGSSGRRDLRPPTISGQVQFATHLTWTEGYNQAHCQAGNHPLTIDLPLNANGSFSLEVSEHLVCILRFVFDDPSCAGYYAAGGLVADSEDAERLHIGQESLRLPPIQFTDATCRYEVHGRLLTATGNPVEGVHMRLIEPDGPFEGWSLPPTTYTGVDGSFTFAAPSETERRIEAWFHSDGCVPHLREGNPAGSSSTLGDVSLEYGDEVVTLLVDDDVCSIVLAGQVINSKGQNVPDARIAVTGDRLDGRVFVEDSDGAFWLPLMEPGDYLVEVWLDDCTSFYLDGTPAVNPHGGRQIKVTHAPVTKFKIAIANGVCEHWVVGTLVAPDGSPISNAWVSVGSDVGTSNGSLAADDGTFMVKAPNSGFYWLAAYIGNCVVYYRSDRATESRDEATLISVEDEDVIGLRLMLSTGQCPS